MSDAFAQPGADLGPQGVLLVSGHLVQLGVAALGEKSVISSTTRGRYGAGAGKFLSFNVGQRFQVGA